MPRKIIFLLCLILLNNSSALAEVFDLGTDRKEGEALSQERTLLKLRLKETPQVSAPIFFYNIEKTINPHKIPKKTFDDSLFLLEKGNNFFSRKNYLKAVEFYRKAAKINPSFVTCYHNMGVAFFILGKYRESIESFEKLMELQPLNGYAYFYLGWIYKKLQNHRLSEYYLKEAKGIFASQANIALVAETEAILNTLKIAAEE